MFHWLYIVASNAKTFISETYYSLPKDYRPFCLDELIFRFSHRACRDLLIQGLIHIVACSAMAY